MPEDDRVDLDLGLAEDANHRVVTGASHGEAAIAARDQMIVGALASGTPVSDAARRLKLTEQSIYQIRDRLERGGPVIAHQATTVRGLEELSDHQQFELVVTQLLQDLDPSLRHTGGSGDRARDAVGGICGQRGDSLIVMVSLEAKWSQKIRREFERIARTGWEGSDVWAVTNRKPPRVRATV